MSFKSGGGGLCLCSVLLLTCCALSTLVAASSTRNEEIVSRTIEDSRKPLTPGEQAQIKTVLETTNKGLKLGSKVLDKYIKHLNIKDVASDAKKLQISLKVLSSVKALMSIAAGSIVVFNVVSTFFMPSELSVILENFEKIDSKLDRITNQINNVKNELESSIEFNAWITTYIDWELDIENGNKKLGDIKKRLRDTSDIISKLKNMQIFIEYFENNNIESKTKKIYTIVTVSKSVTLVNLIEVFVRETKCDVLKLQKFKYIIQTTMMKAATQSAVYELFKHNDIDYVTEKLDKFYDMMYNIRLRFDEQEWQCYKDYKTQINDLVVEVGHDKPQLSREGLAHAVYRQLTNKMYWYDWGVAAYNKDKPLTMTFDCTSTYESKGSEYMLINNVAENNDKNLVIVWQETYNNNLTCEDWEKGQTFIAFSICDGCDKLTSVPASINMKTSQSCKDYKFPRRGPGCPPDLAILPFPLPTPKPHKDTFSFLAAMFTGTIDPCLQSNICNNGICKQIPLTNQSMCMCYSYYEGDTCETPVSIDSTEQFTNLLKGLPDSVIQYGVPTLVEVYMSIQEIPGEIALLNSRISQAFEFSNIITLYGKFFVQAEYVVDKYHEYETGKINKELFMTRVGDDLDRTVTGIETAILGEGILGNEDFFSAYKKSIISQSGQNFACTKEYVERVSQFQEKILTLDQVLAEVRMNIIQWQLQKNINQHLYNLDSITTVLQASQARQRAYLKHWNNNSCSNFYIYGTEIRSFCEFGHSFENFKIPLNCIVEGLYPTPSSMTCTREDGALVWNPKFDCEYSWGSWDQWSDCSVTCGGGTSYRDRWKVNGDADTETRSCNTQMCCERRDGKHKCSRTQCINISQLCDGPRDCSDGDDESTSRCKYLRHGVHEIAIQNPDTKGFLECYPDDIFPEDCETGSCPQHVMNVNDWKSCHYNVFNRIEAVVRSDYDAIRSGDMVGIKKSDNEWVSYYGFKRDYSTRTCPGNHFDNNDHEKCGGERFYIHSVRRLGGCSQNSVFFCIGAPIYPGDEVLLGNRIENDYVYGLTARNVGGDVFNSRCKLPTTSNIDEYERQLRINCKRLLWKIYVRGI